MYICTAQFRPYVADKDLKVYFPVIHKDGKTYNVFGNGGEELSLPTTIKNGNVTVKECGTYILKNTPYYKDVAENMILFETALSSVALISDDGSIVQYHKAIIPKGAAYYLSHNLSYVAVDELHVTNVVMAENDHKADAWTNLYEHISDNLISRKNVGKGWVYTEDGKFIHPIDVKEYGIEKTVGIVVAPAGGDKFLICGLDYGEFEYKEGDISEFERYCSEYSDGCVGKGNWELPTEEALVWTLKLYRNEVNIARRILGRDALPTYNCVCNNGDIRNIFNTERDLAIALPFTIVKEVV